MPNKLQDSHHPDSNVSPVADREVIRVTFRLHGAELEQVREVQELLSFNSELDAARYLMQRGLEAISPILAGRRTQIHMRKQVTTDAIIQAMFDRGFVPDEPKK